MKILLLMFFVMYGSCSFAQNHARVKQIRTAEQIVLRYDTVRQCLNIISFPFEFELYKIVKCGMKVKPVDYYYADTSEKDFCEAGWRGVPYWIENKGKHVLNSSLTKTQERFDLQYYQKKIREKCGDLSLPSVCFYVEWDGTQKYVTITEQGYSLNIIKPHSFFREFKLYHKNTVLKMEGTKLFMSSVNVGIWREYNEQGILINEVDEDKKFSLLSIKPLDVLKYIEREGFINLKTGEGQERFDTTNAINICFEDRNESEKDKSTGMSTKWIIKFYNIEMGKVTTHVLNAENGDIISIAEQFLEE